MHPLGTYTLDTETLKLNAYRLLCLFYANKEIARLSDPVGRGDPSYNLEQLFFLREMTQLLLSIAIGTRVLDDQMCVLPESDPLRQAYMNTRDKVNQRHNCMMFEEMSLREACNKIIHSYVVEPHIIEGSNSHKIDEYNWLVWSEKHDLSPVEVGAKPDPIKWHHLSGHIRLGGRQRGKQWWHLLEVPIFIEAIYELLETRDLTFISTVSPRVNLD